MQKTGFVIILLFTLIMLSSCDIDNDVSSVDKNDTSGSEVSLNKKKGTNNETNLTYDIVQESYIENKEIKIKYPQIANLSGPDVNINDKVKNINQLIKDEALTILNLYSHADGPLTIEINNKVTWKSENLISIQYFGVSYVDLPAAYPINVFYTSNINIATEKKERLNDIIVIDKKFINKLKNGEFKALKPEHDNVLDSFSEEDLMKMLGNADSLEIEGKKIFSYFTDKGLGISVNVIHALGDHAEFEINIQDLRGILKKDHEVWKNDVEN
ncbi:polysaccharide deacetylase family protein [Chengkuizengella marina]|uniref:Deacetylase PdaC domain-containing protein n=1 Tax=Chengkuizengella marina TaxID=2507566 RepID=A0A6N9PWS4_9BACL|nr:DUF4163 domain-containing protein [Chengkuizengella marina]NBI27969.1 hypothetical protein [Chengkuizengella marina]